MANKLKLLIILSILTGTGIIFILGIWLYGSYNNRLELFVSSSERTMFYVVQDVYQLHKNDPEKQNQRPRNQLGFLGKLKDKLKSKYSEKEINTIFEEIDSSIGSERGHNHENREASSSPLKRMDRDFGRGVVTPLSFHSINFSDSLYVEIKSGFDKALLAKGVQTNYKISLQTINRDSIFSVRKSYKKTKKNWTKPILVDPDKSQFIVVKFQDPWKNLLFDLSWQLGISIVLVGVFVGSFFYLFKTIFRQNKLADMRRAFVNNMTHELKTPVSTVMAAVEAIQLYGVKEDKEKMNRYLQISRNELDHLADMIDRVLTMDVDEASGVKLDLSEVDLIFIFESVIDTFKISATKSVNFDFQTNSAEILIQGDSSHIRNVISNLLENAIKYSGDAVDVDINVQDLSNSIEFSVTDNGNGIPKEYQKEIFNMFFRVPEGDLHAVKGFGLGLAYVRQVVKGHGGKIEVQSEEGKGSTFTVKLPKIIK